MDEGKSAKDCFDELFADYSFNETKKISRNERKKNNYFSTTLVYGEIEFAAFAKLFLQLKRHGFLKQTGGVFVDIGSGSGKAVFAATLCHDFDNCIGIEILSDLHSVALDVLSIWDKKIKQQVCKLKRRTKINFYNGDACEEDGSTDWWLQGDLVFVNSTCFTKRVMKDLTSKFNLMRKNSVVITATKSIQSDQFQLIEETTMQESWGDATVYIHKKIM